MATTPPVTTVIDTPPAPRHAGEATRHYSTRKSTRNTFTRTKRAAETPPPDEDLHQKASIRKRASPPSSALHLHSPPSSTQNSPRKRAIKGNRKSHNSIMNAQDSLMDETSTGHSHFPVDDALSKENSKNLNPAHMLPTPASIPRKKSVSQGAVNAAARVLFPPRPETIEDAMPVPRKRRKNHRHVGFSLYSSMEDDGQSSEDKIQIYTDSKDKVPELDESEDNPFLEKPHQLPPPAEPTKARTGRKRKHGHEVGSNPQIEEAFKRDEGMVYVFRGKKIYRKFPQESDSEDEDPSTANHIDDLGAPTLRPMTRSSVKPRLLFPTPQQRAERDAAALEAEEAPTDVEDHTMTQPEEVVTPVKKTFTPATPPTTGHATRSSTKKARHATLSPLDKNEADLELRTEKRKKVSPFDGWARTKAGVGVSGKGRKRVADDMAMDEGDFVERRPRGDRSS